MKNDKTTLVNIAGGRAQALFAREFARVLENIADSRTSAKAERTIIMTFKIKPNELREQLACTIDADSKLAKAGSVGAILFAAVEEEGLEAYNHDPKEQNLLGDFGAAKERAAEGRQ